MLVFISFDQAGEAIYQTLAKRLREVGVEVTAAGRATTSRANKSLQKADALVVLLTAGVLKSPRMRSRALWFHTVAQDHPTKKLIPVWIADGPIADLWPFLTPEMVLTRDIPTAGDDALVAQILAALAITPLPVTKPLVAQGNDDAPAVGRRKIWQLIAVAGLLLLGAVGIGVTLLHGRQPAGSHGQEVGIMASATATFALATTAPAAATETATATQGTAAATGTATIQPSPSPTSAPTATATPIPALLALNAGGPAVGGFGSDADYVGGSPTATAATIDTTKTQHAAPEAIYQTARQGNSITYIVPHLQAGHTYTIRLHFTEYTATAAGMRVFNVTANGLLKLANFDIFAVTGGKNIATVQEFTVAANSQGQIVLTFARTSKHVDPAVVSGIEVYG